LIVATDDHAVDILDREAGVQERRLGMSSISYSGEHPCR
jgi:hypothetical protein